MSEQIGKKIAEQFSSDLRERDSVAASAQQDQQSMKSAIDSLHEALRSSIQGFNDTAPANTKILMTERSDGWQFNLESDLMLTLKFANGFIHLVPARNNRENPTSSKFQFDWQSNPPTYQGVSQNPTFRPPVLHQDRFIQGVLTMICGNHF